MSTLFPIPLKLFPVTVTLDGEVVSLSLGERISLSAIRRSLENLALRRQRVLMAFTVDDMPLSLHRTLVDIQNFQRVAGRTASIEFLGLELLATTRRHLTELIERTQQSSLLALINKPAVARQLWLELQPDLREPLLTLSFLPEISQVRHDGVPALTPPLPQLAEELTGISRHMEWLTQSAEDPQALSDGFDLTNNWLENLELAVQRTRNSLYEVALDL